MFKHTATYTDFLGNQRTEDFRFNLTEKELTTLRFDLIGGNGDFEAAMLRIISEQDQKKLLGIFEQLIDASYGILSPDGKYFTKNKEALDAFKSTQAYSDLYMKLGSDSKFASDFINGTMQGNKEVDENAKKEIESKIAAYIPGAESTAQIVDISEKK